jgi:hypothetical protein
LVIDSCPPPAPADFFYNVTANRPARSSEASNYFRDLALCVRDSGEKPGTAETSEEAVLTEWQRRGLFLGYPVECPYESQAELANRIGVSEKTLLLRLQTSYKPKFVALISEPAAALIDALRANGWGQRLILDGEKPFAGAGFGERLSKALTRV